MLRTGIGDLRAFEGVVGPNFGLYFEDLKKFWAEILVVLGLPAVADPGIETRVVLAKKKFKTQSEKEEQCLHSSWLKRNVPEKTEQHF